VPPTPLNRDDERSPFHDPRYAEVPKNEIPLTESLKECIQRLIPCWENQILPALKKEETILVSAHGNSLR
jgi:2,3-bisphosphoglycerate-dependent phosphoglycerate mutase